MGKLSDLGKKYGKPSSIVEDETKSESAIDEHTDVAIIETKVPDETFVEEVLLPMSWINITKIVYEKDLFPVDILSILYSAIHDSCKTAALVVSKEGFGKVQLYLGVRDNGDSSKFVSKYILQKALKGLLPGVAFHDIQATFDNQLSNKKVATVAGIPSLKNDKKAKFSQGIERLINASVDIPNYSIILIADSISDEYLLSKISSLEKKYSELSIKAELTNTTSENQTSTKSETNTEGNNSSNSESYNDTTNENSTHSEATSESKGDSLAFIVGGTSSEGSTKTDSTTSGTSNSKGGSNTSGKSDSHSVTFGENSTSGTSQQVKFEDKSVKNQLKSLEKELGRLIASKGNGLWRFNAYFVADNFLSVQALASLYKGLIVGAESQDVSIKVRNFEDKESPLIRDQISNAFIHSEYKSDIFLNSDELAICMNLPQTSVPGILVCEQVSFGRNIHLKDNRPLETISVGCLHHLGSDDYKNRLELDVNLLTSHVFISGTTGSGKSNALYLLLAELIKQDKKFMVIEPAKGEYKDVFGHQDGVTVFGVLPGFEKVLKLNPFSFPKEIHVEEHIDRLIDIFNACWPMYAAMPSVLKAAVSNAYRSCGWNLMTSTSEYEIYPTIHDVIRELSDYINQSEYSSDSKGDYKGALQTRLEGLTYGIIGNVFNGGDISPEILFDTNVIIDLSHVGSPETKSLIMGLLILKLNEYRVASSTGTNKNLQHITVLEEAHNLLKATSTAQSQESSNLAGKSVEMIASAIAEMRTYGESFIIADQSPALLDRSVIRNTNTKIVFSLPDFEDREIAASSFNLSDAQTGELSKLSTGIAAVFQKGWEEPVLAHFDKFEQDSADVIPQTSKYSEEGSHLENKTIRNANLASILYDGFTQLNRVFINELETAIRIADISGCSKYKLLHIVHSFDLDADTYAKMMVYLVGIEAFVKASKEKDIKTFEKLIRNAITSVIGNHRHIDTLTNAYIKGCSDMNESPFYDAWLLTKNKK